MSVENLLSQRNMESGEVCLSTIMQNITEPKQTNGHKSAILQIGHGIGFRSIRI